MEQTAGKEFLEKWQKETISRLTDDVDALGQVKIKEDHLLDLILSSNRLRAIWERQLAEADHQEIPVSADLLHETVSQHFSGIQVHRHRGLNGLELSRLSRINIVAGINNSGKTSLLEAIFLLCRQNEFDGLKEMVRQRGKIPPSQLDNVLFLNSLPEAARLSADFNGKHTEIRMENLMNTDRKENGDGYADGVRIIAVNEGETTERVWKYRGIAGEMSTGNGTVAVLCPCLFSSPFFNNEPGRYTKHYRRAFKFKILSEIISFCQSHVSDGITDIRLVDDRNRFQVLDSRFDQARDLTEYGDGLQRVFFTTLLFASARNGVVLIDEFENAIHTELLGEFVGFIDNLSKRFNTQVFLTSHSKEAVDAFVHNIADPDDFSVCALVAKDGQILPREYTGKKYRALVEAGGVDLRRAR